MGDDNGLEWKTGRTCSSRSRHGLLTLSWASIEEVNVLQRLGDSRRERCVRAKMESRQIVADFNTQWSNIRLHFLFI